MIGLFWCWNHAFLTPGPVWVSQQSSCPTIVIFPMIFLLSEALLFVTVISFSGLGGSKYISFEERQWHNDCFNCKKCLVSLVGRGFLTERDDILCPDCGKDIWSDSTALQFLTFCSLIKQLTFLEVNCKAFIKGNIFV